MIRSKESALAIFLMRLKTGLPYETLSVIFSFRNLQQIERICTDVQNCFETDIILFHIGIRHLRRELLVERQSKLAKLLVPNSELILIADGTYAYHEKSTNNNYQRKSYSVHKHQNLCKPFTVCTTDGYIVDFFGPYIGTSNDAKILNDILENTELKSLLKPNDCFVVDRGFRDVIKKIESMGYSIIMPALRSSEKQLTTKQANESRVVTKIRWVVECIHGIVKQKWKILNDFRNVNLHKVKPFFRIAGSLQNMYGKKLLCDFGKEDEVAKAINDRKKDENALQRYIVDKSLDKVRKVYIKMDAIELKDFPRLSVSDLENITLGKYQISQSLSYISEHFNMEQFSIFVCTIEPNIIRTKIQSRHISRKTYWVYVQYVPNGTGPESIEGWACSCANGLRVIGCCVHSTSVIAYLSCFRYQSRTFQPAKHLNDLFKEAQPIINNDSEED